MVESRAEGSRTADGGRTATWKTLVESRAECSRTADGGRTATWKTMVASRAEGRTADGGRTGGSAAGGGRTESRTAGGVPTESRTAGGAQTDGSAAGGARTDERMAGGGRTDGSRWLAGAHRTEDRADGSEQMYCEEHSRHYFCHTYFDDDTRVELPFLDLAKGKFRSDISFCPSRACRMSECVGTLRNDAYKNAEGVAET
jgi:hypothetical protein